MESDSGRNGHNGLEISEISPGAIVVSSKCITVCQLTNTKSLEKQFICIKIHPIRDTASLFVQVKIPITKIGLQAASTLAKSGARVTMTGVYSVHQVRMFHEENCLNCLRIATIFVFPTVFFWSYT